MDDEENLSLSEGKEFNIEMIMDYLEYKGYKGTVEYSKEDECLVGKVIGMHSDLILYEGNTLNELKEDFIAAVESYLEGCKAEGKTPKKPFSGKILVRMSSDLHERITIAATDSHITINEFITKALDSELMRL